MNNPIERSRLMPKYFKWNDAVVEKWIMNRQANHSKSSDVQRQVMRMQVKNFVKFAPESLI